MHGGQGCRRCRIWGVALAIVCLVVSVQLIMPMITAYGRDADVCQVPVFAPDTQGTRLLGYPSMDTTETMARQKAESPSVLVEQAPAQQAKPRWVF